MAHILSVDANTDLITKYGHAFRQSLVFADFLQRWPHHTLASLQGAQVAQPAINKYILENEIDYISVCGHGQNGFKGFNNTSIWTQAEAAQLLRGKIAHFLTCQEKGRFARALLAGGVRAFWGYSEAFKFYYLKPGPSDPSQDALARIFFKMDCIIDEGVLDLKSGESIYSEVTEYFHETYELLEDDPASQVYLLNNYEGLVYPNSDRPDATL